ncbi:siderophore biosynthesis protein PvsD [Shewanella sp. VB17]|uniref:IucA/IucC family protein n=1 Tax=Shewanella sp. VB17 TaxID=2739432 RepID=UPI001566586D|nr:IucA/IucC family protein [Shewanella sp. VB17]NRD75565.1 siderophore biosynthesis protein PvsD [Shewanella sp. VB17]
MQIQSQSKVEQEDDKYRVQVFREQAESNAIACLLNCYLREFAIVRQEVDFDDALPDCPLSLSLLLTQEQQKVRIRFPESGSVLLLIADRVSLLGRVSISSPIYFKKLGCVWQISRTEHLIEFMLQHLAKLTNTQFNHELQEQIANSINVTQAFLQRLNEKNRLVLNTDMNAAVKSLIGSEQSLLWGHAMHPSPKSRHGVSFDDMLACSPEIQANFPLYWFEVDPSLIKQLHCTDVKPMEWIDRIKPSNVCLYPCHPWEVKTILAQPLVQRAMAFGLIKPLGEMGAKVCPTSSVRTTYIPDINQFMKFSIHVRLTNCVRKNAWYELESAVALSRVLMKVASDGYAHCPNFSLMAEPGASTLDLSALENVDGVSVSQSDHLMVSECFGILYREGISISQLEQYKPEMAGALFAWDSQGDSIGEMRMREVAKRRQQSYQQTVVQWFGAYIEVLLPSIFYFFFKRGVAFEPHLQNTVIGFEDDMPAYIWLRDLEGTKLLPEFWPSSSLPDLSEEAKSSVYYTRELGWSRIAYCSLINNVSEAMFHLAAGDRALETELWQLLANVVEQWQQVEGEEPELVGLLQGEKIPAKNNLSTRLFMKADRLSSYTQLTNPLAMLKNEVMANLAEQSFAIVGTDLQPSPIASGV